MWISFNSFGNDGYPCLVKIATGKINAVTGEEWRDGAHRDPQDYVVVPGQPWLDGYCVKKGEIAQFVAMPLGEGYTVEEQVTGEAEFGGLQIVVYPMKAAEWEKILKKREEERRLRKLTMSKARGKSLNMFKGLGPKAVSAELLECCRMDADMGLAPGGRMKQEIEKDPYDLDVWDLRHGSRLFVHLANSLTWRAITGEAPPTVPPTAKDYKMAGLPWFDFYGKGEAVEGSGVLAGLKTVLGMGKEKGESPLPENESFDPDEAKLVNLGRKKDVVREGDF